MAGDVQLDTETFADLLRKHRLARNWTQEALAERAGLSTRGISDLERGVRTQPYRETLRHLIGALGLSGEERAQFIRAARGPSRPSPRAQPRPRPPDLPIPLDHLVGRDDEIAAIAALLTDETVRIVTLTGPGGVGKTRLALAVAERMTGAFPDGVVFVDLAPLRDPALVPETVAAALGLDRPGTAAPLDFLRRVLADRHVLILFDNFEHLLTAAPIVTDLLRAGPGLKALVTSREALRLRGEREYQVLPLAVPNLATAGWREETIRSASVRLFVLRATETQADFSLTEENAFAVAGICRELEGLPLAIELAAPRIKVLPIPALLARLERRLPLLTGGSRDSPERQRTLRDAIAWSYDLLSPDEQALFRRLAVFLGGWTLEAAEAVAGGEGGKGEWNAGDPTAEPGGASPSPPRSPLPPFPPSHPPPATLALIASLVDKSLVRRDDAEAETRFSMLETIREYAAEQLHAEPGEDAAARASHARFFLTLAEDAHGGLVGAAQAAWLDRLDAEDANIRAALSWAVEQGEADLALRGSRALWRYWTSRGRLREGRAWLERALALPGTAAVSPAVRADAHNALGNLLGDSGEFTSARTQYEAALALRREFQDSEAIAGALNNLGLIAAWLGDYDTATALHTESLTLRQERFDPFAVALSLSNLGDVHLAQGDFARAQELQDEALRLRDRAQDALGSAYSRYNLGEIARLQGDTAAAAAHLGESLRRFEELGDRIGIAYAESSLGELAAREGDSVHAAELLGQALRTRGEIGDRRGTVECLEAIAVAALRHGDGADGSRLMAAALAQRAALSCPVPPATAADRERELGAARYRQLLAESAPPEGDADDLESALNLAWSIVERLVHADGVWKPVVRLGGRWGRG